MGVREKCFSAVCLYLENADQGRVSLVWRGKACVMPEAEGTGHLRGLHCGCACLSHPQHCQGSRAIIPLGWMC